MLRTPLPPGFTLFPLGSMRVWDCRLCPLLLFGAVSRFLFFRDLFLPILLATYIPCLFAFIFLKDIFFFLAMITSKRIHRNTTVVSQRWTCHLNVLPGGKSRSHSACVSSIKRIITLGPANNGNFLASIIRPEDSSSPPSLKPPPGVQLS